MARIVNPTATKNILERICQDAFDEVLEQLARGFRELIESPVFDWPNTTRRRNGQVVSTPRDIVDRGDLRDSQQLTKSNPRLASFVWGVRYALYVHQGWTTVSGQELPGRDWTTPVAKQAPDWFVREVRRRV